MEVEGVDPTRAPNLIIQSWFLEPTELLGPKIVLGGAAVLVGANAAAEAALGPTGMTLSDFSDYPLVAVILGVVYWFVNTMREERKANADALRQEREAYMADLKEVRDQVGKMIADYHTDSVTQTNAVRELTKELAEWRRSHQ